MNPADQYRRALERLVQRQAQHIDTLARLIALCERKPSRYDDELKRAVEAATTTAAEAKIVIRHLSTDGGFF